MRGLDTECEATRTDTSMERKTTMHSEVVMDSSTL